MYHSINTNCNRKNCPACDTKSPLFSKLSSDELEKMNANRFELSFKPGEIIRKQGAYLSHVIVLTSGLASLYIEGLNNRNLILKIVRPGNFIGGPGMFVHHRHHYTVKTHLPTEACFIEVSAFKQIIYSNKAFAEEFFKDFSFNTLNTYNRLINLTQRYVPGRLAEVLIYLCEQIFEAEEFDLIFTSRELGTLADMSTDSVLKTLREFRKAGIIGQAGKKISIHDMDALRRISETG